VGARPDWQRAALLFGATLILTACSSAAAPSVELPLAASSHGIAAQIGDPELKQLVAQSTHSTPHNYAPLLGHNAPKQLYLESRFVSEEHAKLLADDPKNLALLPTCLAAIGFGDGGAWLGTNRADTLRNDLEQATGDPYNLPEFGPAQTLKETTITLPKGTDPDDIDAALRVRLQEAGIILTDYRPVRIKGVAHAALYTLLDPAKLQALYAMDPHLAPLAPTTLYLYRTKKNAPLHLGFAAVEDADLTPVLGPYDAKLEALFEGIETDRRVALRPHTLRRPTPAPKLKKDEINAFFTLENATERTVRRGLEAQGLRVIGDYYIAEDAGLKVLVYTDDLMIRISGKLDHAFAGVLRVMIDEAASKATFLNPEYYQRAVRRDAYLHRTAGNYLVRLKRAFPRMQPASGIALSKETLATITPAYGQMITVAKGNFKELLTKLLGNASQRIVFDLKLDTGTLLFGLSMPPQYENWIYEADPAAALALPVLLIIDKNEAKILDPDFIRALFFPHVDDAAMLRTLRARGDTIRQMRAIFE